MTAVTTTVLERPVIQAAPAQQPRSVARIAERLFPAYELDGGRAHLAGCTLEDRLIVRLRGGLDDQPVEFFLDGEGRDVDQALVRQLRLDEVVLIERAPPLASVQLKRFLVEGLIAVQQRLQPEVDFQVQSMTAIWCKFAEGKLRFTFGEVSADLPFAGWAQTLQPPPFVCPATGQEGFHLAVTDDGRVTLAELIGRCEETGRRALLSELVTCEATGKRVLADLVSACPVSGEHTLDRVRVACAMCGQQVSPATVKKDRCAACRSLRPVPKADPRMARLFDEHPELDRWRSWRLAETAEVYILVGSGWLRRLLVVADKHSLELKLLATGNRFLPAWDFIPPEQHEHALRD